MSDSSPSVSSESTSTESETGHRPVIRRRLRLLVYGIAFSFIAFRLFDVLNVPELEVGPATTVVAGPIQEDGLVNYAEVLNLELSRNVTPENNAAVLFARAFGPTLVAEPIRDEYFEQLGMTTPPSDGAYLMPLEDFVFLSRIPLGEMPPTLFSDTLHWYLPFTPEQKPAVSAWLAESGDALALIHEACEREYCYSPIVMRPGMSLSEAGYDHTLHGGLTAIALYYRCLMNIGTGNMEQACDDALTCHRLARLLTHHPFPICFMISSGVSRMASVATEKIVLSGKLSPEAAQRLRRELDALPEFREFDRTVEFGVRFVSLDAAQRLFHGTQPAVGAPVPQIVLGSLDGNVLLRSINHSFDEIESAMGVEDREERWNRLQKLSANYSNLQQVDLHDPVLMTRMLVLERRSTLSRRVANVKMRDWTPPFLMIQELEEVVAVSAELNRLGSVLAEYQAAHGEYPESLQELVPEYLSRVPIDNFDGKPLKYYRIEDGFALYSVGPDGSDDLGLRRGSSKDLAFGTYVNPLIASRRQALTSTVAN